MISSQFSVAFLVGNDTASTRQSIEAVAALPGVRVAGVLLDNAPQSFAARRKNFWKNIRRDGWAYPVRRVLGWANARLDGIAARTISETEVQELLSRAFPERSYSLPELCERRGFPLYEVGNLNSPQAAESLRRLRPDLGIVLGTRILKRSTFAVPRLGSINLHKGKVPEYRGMPPAFWELYDGCTAAGVTIHQVDNKLDTGAVFGTRQVSIHRHETESSLLYKLDVVGSSLLAECIAALAGGTARVVPQPEYSGKARTIPSRKQREELRRRIPQSLREPGLRKLAKTACYLAFYYCGVVNAVRVVRRWRGNSRAVVLLYHRVNDYSDDVLTVSTRRFAEHLCLFKKFYQVKPSEWMVDRLRAGERIPFNTVLIHFDDCYADVLVEGGPLLKACGMPATTFISSGFVDTNRVFQHDAEMYPFRYPNFTSEQVRRLADFGFEVGAHTINHANLGESDVEQARIEVTEGRSQLETILGRDVRLFSFPWGRHDTMREEVRPIVRDVGYKAMFCVEDRFVDAETDLFDIPRYGVSLRRTPLELMMDIEGLSPSGIVYSLRRLLGGGAKPASGPLQPVAARTAALNVSSLEVHSEGKAVTSTASELREQLRQ